MTKQEAEQLSPKLVWPDKMFYSKEEVEGFLDTWHQVWDIMERDQDFSEDQGGLFRRGEIHDWVQELAMVLHNERMYDEALQVNEQILKIQFSDAVLIYENAKREIADILIEKGDEEKGLQLYEEYLAEDPLWGWGWIGYYRALQQVNDPRFETVLDELLEKGSKGTEFRDAEDLYYELTNEFNELGKQEKAEECKRLAKSSRGSRGISFPFASQGIEKPKSAPIVNAPKVGRNDPCPCGSGKKYKKCCGKNL